MFSKTNSLENDIHAKLSAELEQALLKSFDAIRSLHDALGAEGQKVDRLNQFGESALRMDWDAEEIYIANFKALGHSFRLVSEEHGDVAYGDKPIYTLVLDGIDGTLVYKSERGTGCYGSMAGTFLGAAPRYQDYLASGFTILSPQWRSFTCRPGKGCAIFQGIESSGLRVLEQSSKPISDWVCSTLEFPQAVKEQIKMEVLTKFPGTALRSMAAEYARILNGETDFFLDFTHKSNLEQMIAFGVLLEAGAGIFTLDGKSIAYQSYDAFGQSSQIPLLVLGDPSQLNKFLELIKK